MKFDTHCHTKEGSIDGKVPIESYIKILRDRGFGGMIVTDHNSYKGYKAYKETIEGKKYEDFVVLKGIEYDTFDSGHIIVIMPENVKLRILELRGLPIKLLVDIVHKHGGILGPAHPCGEKFLSITNTYSYKKNHDEVMRFDFIETFNACESEVSNEKARMMARRYDKATFGGSDAHRADCIGLAYTEFPDYIKKESDLIRYIREKNYPECGGEYYNKTTKDKLGKINAVLVNSFWLYNKVASFIRRRERQLEIRRNRHYHHLQLHK